MTKHYIGILILTIVILIVGFVGLRIAGSPAESRAVRYDQIRIQDISKIKGAIETYFQDHLKLPVSVDQLLAVRVKTAQPYLKKQPVDPQNKTAYTYTVKGPSQYDLCATFDTSSEEIQKRKLGSEDLGQSYPDSYSQSNSHPEGLYCFSYTIPGYLYERQVQQKQLDYSNLYRQSTSSAY